MITEERLRYRDHRVLSMLASLPLTGRQAVVEVLRVLGHDILLPGMSREALEADVTNLQSAMEALTDPETREMAKVDLVGLRSGDSPANPARQAAAVQLHASVNGIPLWPTPLGMNDDHAFLLRVIDSGH